MNGTTRRGFIGTMLSTLSVIPLLGFLRGTDSENTVSIQKVEHPETDLIGWSNNSWTKSEYYFEPWPSLSGRDAEGDLHCKGIYVDAWSIRPESISEIFASERSVRWFVDRVVALLESGTIPLALTRPSNQNGVIVEVANLNWPKIYPYEVFPIEAIKIPEGWFA